MSEQFKELYDYCQTLQIKVGRNDVIEKIKEITGKPVKIIKTNLDTNIVRGYFLSASNTEHKLVRQYGGNLIVAAQNMKVCWDRFVFVKEAMHLLDHNGECTDSPEKFEALINTWTYPSPKIEDSSPEKRSDVAAMLMALGCFCPEKFRLEFKEQIAAGAIDEYNIALKLRIPQTYIAPLLSDNFVDVQQHLIRN